MDITFEQLPKAVTELFGEVLSIKQLLIEQSSKPQPPADQWFNITELAAYLPNRPAKATIYCQVSAKTIPYHKGAKHLRFLKSEIDEWLKQGRKKTLAEIDAETDAFISSQKKKGGKNG
jgi:hypothetical protein